ncbi:MAG: hypothetical protein JXL80_17895 [Planctomycetes bacterium]|jgi:hypothetical protein|nr:hypothetical protein [Planctomycetota bacterium]
MRLVAFNTMSQGGDGVALLEREPKVIGIDDVRPGLGRLGHRADLTGLGPQIEAPCSSSGVVPDRPLDIAWIDDELLLKTRRVWSKEYGRAISEGEAVEILVNVKRLAEVLLGPKWRKPNL